MILLLFFTYLISIAVCYEEKSSVNVTTLYPVTNSHTNSTNETSENDNYYEDKIDKQDKNVPFNEEQHKGQSKESDNINTESFKGFDNSSVGDFKDNENITLNDDTVNATISNTDEKLKGKPEIPKLDKNNWKIDSTFTPSKLDKQESHKNNADNKAPKVSGKDFKPSPQLGHFYSEDDVVVPTQATIDSFFPMNNPSSYFSSPGDFYKLNYKPPGFSSDPFKSSYKFQNTGPSRVKEGKFRTETKVTEGHEKIPAGGLYKLPDPFKEKPGSDGDDDNFGLDFKDEDKGTKENSVKKRGNPWKHFLQMVTALIPVGILLSALTPNLITLESVDNPPHYGYGDRFSRRSGEDGLAGGAADLPAISERCKRRLLCELHSDQYYPAQGAGRQKHCYKIHCDDPLALEKVLQWLLHTNRTRGQRPATTTRDRRAYIT